MLSVRKGTTKRCCYRACKSDTRYKSYKENLYYFINFPKPCLEYRKNKIQVSKTNHFKSCPKCKKCEFWVKKCGRSDRFLSLDDVTKDTYICSLHFYGESGPTDGYPDPQSHQELLSTNKISENKVIKSRTSLSEKYNKVKEEKSDVSMTMNVHTFKTNEQTLLENEGSTYLIDKNDCNFEEKFFEESSTHEINGIKPQIKCECHNSTSIEVQTDFVKTRNKIIQVKIQKNSVMKNLENSFCSDDKKCIFYTSLHFEQLIALHKFLSPACKNLDCRGSRSKKIDVKDKSDGKIVNLKSKFTSFQELILVILRLRMGYLIEDLAYQFEVSTGLISKICTTWIYFLYNEFTTQFKQRFMFPPQKVVAETLAKKFRLLQIELPLNMRTMKSQIIFVCACLGNFQKPMVCD